MKKTVVVCDNCGSDIGDTDTLVKLSLDYGNKARTLRVADYCEGCAEALPGRGINRRGRPPKNG